MLDLSELRGIAEDAAPGPWTQEHEIDGVFHGRATVVKALNGMRIVTVGQTRQHVTPPEPNVAFIAAFNPAVVLKLLDVVEAAQKCDSHGIGRWGGYIFAASQEEAEVLHEALEGLQDA